MSLAAVPRAGFFSPLFPYAGCIIAPARGAQLLSMESSNLEMLEIMISLLSFLLSLSLSSPSPSLFLSIFPFRREKKTISSCLSPARLGLCQLGLSALGFLLPRYNTFVHWSKNHNSSSFARGVLALPFQILRNRCEASRRLRRQQRWRRRFRCQFHYR